MARKKLNLRIMAMKQTTKRKKMVKLFKYLYNIHIAYFYLIYITLVIHIIISSIKLNDSQVMPACIEEKYLFFFSSNSYIKDDVTQSYNSPVETDTVSIFSVSNENSTFTLCVPFFT